jgi:hypothetical protein
MYVKDCFCFFFAIQNNLFQYNGLRQLFHNALNENNLINDGDFDWIKPLQEHRLNRNKTINTTVIPSNNNVSKKIINNVNATSLSTARNNEFRNRTIAPRTQLPLSSTNATTATLNGGSKTTLSMASTTKNPVNLPSTRSTIENQRPIPAKRRSLVVPPISTYSSNHTESSTNVNNYNKEQHSSCIGQQSEATCCFFKRKAKQALQITSTATRKT